jgi:hypothetical protein
MKYIKLFEVREKKPYVEPVPYFGDYVICKMPDDRYRSDTYKDIKEFLPTVIGKVFRYNNNEYSILFNEEDIPERFKWFFTSYENPHLNYEVWFNRKDIIEWSKDRNDLEAIFSAKKYNL